MKAASHNMDRLHSGEAGRILVRLRSGSHLYGTATAESDEDIRGVYLPTADSILAGDFRSVYCTDPNAEGVRNTPDSRNETFVSLYYFLEMALDGETSVLDWLHCPLDNENVLSYGKEWAELVVMRRLFYSRSLKGSVGHARRQAAKYGIWGSRLDAVEAVLQVMKRALVDAGPQIRMVDIWGRLPGGEHRQFHADRDPPVFEVCEMKFQKTALVAPYADALQKFHGEYGRRAKLAQKNESINWKAISHALRLAFQFEAVLVDGGYTYPLKQAGLLRQVELGQMDWTSEVQPLLEGKIEQIEKLAAESDLPEEPQRSYIRKWLVSLCAFEVESMYQQQRAMKGGWHAGS